MGRTVDIPVFEVFVPLLEPSRYKGAHGGRGAAKSHFFGDLLIEECLRMPTRAVCIREIQNSLEQSVKRLLEDKIKTYGLEHDFRILNTHIETPGDGIITFQGMQNHTADTIKSLEKFRIGWVEEAQSLSKRSLNLLRPTFFRVPHSELWFSWNPRNEDDPVDVMLRGPDRVPDAIVVQTTYKDNPLLPDGLRKEMEWDRRTDPEKYAHVWLGGYERKSEARVFKNWRVMEFVAPANTHYMLGADWGFSNDPATLVRCYEETHDVEGKEHERKRLYIENDLYAVGVEIDHLPAFFDGLVCGCQLLPNGTTPIQHCRDRQNHAWARPWPIVADSARPETISYMRRHGYSGMEAARKGANSVKEGVIFLQGYDIIIHPRCRHTIDEFTLYSYQVDRMTERVLPILEDKKNHIIDPTRYAVEQLRRVIRQREAVWG